MEGRSRRRCLRNNSHCVPIDNIFKNNDYIVKSTCNSIPPQILSKLKKFQSFTCEDINSLIFVNNQSHSNALQRMNEVIQRQKGFIKNETPSKNKDEKKFSHNASEILMADEKQVGLIKNEVQQHQYQLGSVYEKHNHYNQYAEQILCNQFFRNDLQNIFLQ